MRYSPSKLVSGLRQCWDLNSPSLGRDKRIFKNNPGLKAFPICRHVNTEMDPNQGTGSERPLDSGSKYPDVGIRDSKAWQAPLGIWPWVPTMPRRILGIVGQWLDSWRQLTGREAGRSSGRRWSVDRAKARPVYLLLSSAIQERAGERK